MVDSRYSAPVSQAVIIADISLLTTSFLAGTFGNGRVCILYWKNKGPPKAPQVLFANLSVIGFLSSIVCIFGWLLLVVMNYVVKFTVPVVLCFLIVPFAFALVILNAICLTLMAISRQDCVLRPFNQRITQQNVKKVILFSWFLVLALTLAFLFFEIFAKESVCHNFKPYDLLNKLSSSNSSVLYSYFYEFQRCCSSNHRNNFSSYCEEITLIDNPSLRNCSKSHRDANKKVHLQGIRCVCNMLVNRNDSQRVVSIWRISI